MNPYFPRQRLSGEVGVARCSGTSRPQAAGWSARAPIRTSTVLPDAAGGHIVLRNRVGLRRCQGVKEPSRELLHALTDATTDMARELLAIGDDWELTCARLRQARKQE